MKKLQIIFIGISVVLFISGCSSKTWYNYSPPMSGIVGKVAQLKGDTIFVAADEIGLVNDNNISFLTEKSSSKEVSIINKDREAVLNLLKNEIGAELGIDISSEQSLNVSGIEIDMIKDWEWINANQTFIYAGARAKTVTLDVNKSHNLKLGKREDSNIGEMSIQDVGNKYYHIEINNPKVYYKVQLARVEEKLSDIGDGWISDQVKNQKPIELGENEQLRDRKIKKSQFKLFKESMPVLSLYVRDGNLTFEYRNSRDTNVVNLSQYMRNNVIRKSSVYIDDFEIEDFRKKFILFDIKAIKEGSKYKITHARYRYPEYELKIIKKWSFGL